MNRDALVWVSCQHSVKDKVLHADEDADGVQVDCPARIASAVLTDGTIFEGWTPS